MDGNPLDRPAAGPLRMLPIAVGLLLVLCGGCSGGGLSIRPVTVAQFRAFVQSTGYRTDSERYGWSYEVHGVFEGQGRVVEQGFWEKPDGLHPAPDDFPVTCVSWNDARAYCAWAGVRLPSEAEFWAASSPLPMHIAGKSILPAADVSHIGNVWDWTSNEAGAAEAIITGGSFLCTETTCAGYRRPTGSRTISKDTGNSNLGFSIVP